MSPYAFKSCCATLCALSLFACSRQPSTQELRTVRLSDLPLTASDSTLILRWPQFLLASVPGRFLWGERGDVITLISSGSSLDTVGDSMVEVTLGLDRLVAADRTSDGTLGVLDSSGQVVVRESRSREMWSFRSERLNPAGDLAVSQRRVFLLLEGDLPDRPAVAAYSLNGGEAGTWGRVGTGGILQANTNGGGITACPDGLVYYSYINSREIFRVDPTEEGSDSRAVTKSATFEESSASQVRRAYREGQESHSVGPVIQLALRASRVLALHCSDDGILFRQVAHPGHGGAVVEAWDPASGTLLGSFDTGQGVLMDVQDQVLYLGQVSEEESFVLERIHYELRSISDLKKI